MKFLFQSVDISALVFFRVTFGLLAFIDVLSIFLFKHWRKNAFDVDQFQFGYYGFEWVYPLPEPWMSLLFVLLMLASWGILLGLWYRWATLFFAFGFSYLFLLEKAYYLNHGYLFCILSFLLFFLPAHQSFSLDVQRNAVQKRTWIAYWPLFLLQFMMGLVYCYGGIAKINSDWLQGMPLKIWLKAKSEMPLIGELWTQEWVAYAMSYGGLFFDLFVVLFLINRRTRWAAFGLVLFFHTINLLLFNIGVFPFLSIALTLLFFSPDFPKVLVQWIFQKSAFIKRAYQALEIYFLNIFPQKAIAPPKIYSPLQKRALTWSIVLFCTVQLLLPLRHHCFKGPVAWTEEGHRFAWRMMLRDKTGYGYFEVKTKSQDRPTRVNPNNYLSERQLRKMYTHPDMILQFAHLIRDEYRTKWQEEVEVYAQIKVRLNGRKYQHFIDPGKDLAKIEWEFFTSSEWIETLEESVVK